MPLFDRITQNPKVMAGKPFIGGTRMPVSVIVSHVAQGRSFDEILEDFPYIEREDIQAALDYAAYRTSELEVDLKERV